MGCGILWTITPRKVNINIPLFDKKSLSNNGYWTVPATKPITMRMNWDKELDARNLLCPLPVLKARKRLQEMSAGQVLCVVTTDPAAVIDIPHFCAESGHELIEQRDESETQVFLIRRQ